MNKLAGFGIPGFCSSRGDPNRLGDPFVQSDNDRVGFGFLTGSRIFLVQGIMVDSGFLVVAKALACQIPATVHIYA